MSSAVLLLIAAAFLIAWPLAWLVRRISTRLGAFDSAGVAGQVKLTRRKVPNTGGIAVFWGIVLPIVVGLPLVGIDGGRLITALVPAAEVHLAGMRSQTGLAVSLVACLAALHVLGLIDDRRPMGPWIKLAIMAAPALVIPLLFPQTRLLTLLDGSVGGPWLSIAITVVWFVVITNAMNFMDNMDGLSAGVAAVAATFFLIATLLQPQPQWFVAAVLALVVGSCAGFLVFNFPWRRPASIYMGDGGSLVLGFVLAFLTVRTTYLPHVAKTFEIAAGPMAGTTETAWVSTVPWYAVLMPVIVLAVPLYDFVSVVLIRLSQGRSPFVGDTQHLSHRLVRLGLSRRAAVCVIYGMTAIAGVTGVLLSKLDRWHALLAGLQVLMLLVVLAMFEFAKSREDRRGEAGE